MNIDFKKIFRTIALLSALILMVSTYVFMGKTKEQKNIIEKQEKKMDQYKEEIIRLKMVEESYIADKDYIYECFKQKENSAERSGK